MSDVFHPAMLLTMLVVAAFAAASGIRKYRRERE